MGMVGFTQNALGQQVQTYNGLPILIVEDDEAGVPILPFTKPIRAVVRQPVYQYLCREYGRWQPDRDTELRYRCSRSRRAGG